LIYCKKIIISISKGIRNHEIFKLLRKKTYIPIYILLIFSLLTIDALPTNCPLVVNFKGIILANNGSPLDDCLIINFSIIDDQNRIIWENKRNVCVQKGLFHIKLGEKKPLDCAILNHNYYVQVITEPGFVVAQQIEQKNCSNPLEIIYEAYASNLLQQQKFSPVLINFKIYNEKGKIQWTEKKVLKLNGGSVCNNLGIFKPLYCNFFNGKHYLYAGIKGHLRQPYSYLSSLISKSSFSLRPKKLKTNNHYNSHIEKKEKEYYSKKYYSNKKNSLSNEFGYQEEYRVSQTWPVLRQSWYFSLPLDVAVNKENFVYISKRP